LNFCRGLHRKGGGGKTSGEFGPTRSTKKGTDGRKGGYSVPGAKGPGENFLTRIARRCTHLPNKKAAAPFGYLSEGGDRDKEST